MNRSRRKKLAAARKKTQNRRSNKKSAGCGNNIVRDRISQLPDDILVSVISRLSLREATATSILSSRWRHLYIHLGRPVFPTFGKWTSFRKNSMQQIEEEKFPIYLNRIDRILDSYRSGRILKEFTLRLPRLKGANIETWLEFALSRPVETIDIHRTLYLDIDYCPYKFSLSTLIVTKSTMPSFNSLKELRLRNMDVEDRDIELLVSNFTVLESLSILLCHTLRNVSVVGRHDHPELKLKHLEICWSKSVESIHVANVINLVSLRCFCLPRTCVLVLDNVPNLAKLSTSDRSPNTFDRVLSSFPPCILDQLLHLQLLLHPRCTYDFRPSMSYIVPKLINVKHLELQVDMYCFVTFKLVPLIEACPLLEKLEVAFWWIGETKFSNDLRGIFYRINPPNKHIKQVRFSGYIGSADESEFVLYIIKKAVALEELIIETREEVGRKARARARRHFRPATPSSVNLIII